MAIRSKKRMFLRLMTSVSFLCATITYLLFPRDNNAASKLNLQPHIGRNDKGDLCSREQVVPQSKI